MFPRFDLSAFSIVKLHIRWRNDSCESQAAWVSDHVTNTNKQRIASAWRSDGAGGKHGSPLKFTVTLAISCITSYQRHTSLRNGQAMPCREYTSLLRLTLRTRVSSDNPEYTMKSIFVSFACRNPFMPRH